MKKEGFKISRRMIVIVCLILYLLISIILLRGEYLQIKEIGEGYLKSFFSNIRLRYTISVVTFILTYLIVYFSNRSMRKSIIKFFEEDKKEIPKFPNKSISFIVSLIASLITPAIFSEKIINFANATQFGIRDPIFSMDISTFLFKMPLIKVFMIFGIVFFALLTAYNAIYYIVTLNVYLDGVDSESLKKNHFIRQIVFNVVIIGLLVSGLVFVSSIDVVSQDMLKLNTQDAVTLVGAGITEVKIKIWGYRIFAFVILFSIFRIIHHLKKFQVKKVIYSLLIVPIYLILLFVVMSGYEYLYAEKNELDKQSDYIGYNIEFTREAYELNIDDIEVTPNISLEASDIENNSDFLSQIPIITEKATMLSLNEYMNSTGFYEYNNTQLGIYNINGRKTPVYITPRELATSGSRTYTNKRYQYTHGYGIVATSVNEADELGNVKNIQSSFDMVENKIYIKEPRIYYGMTTNDTVIVNPSKDSEFDYPITTTSYKENAYKGMGGIKCNIVDALVLALNEGDLKIAVSGDLTNGSKILTNRNIRDRAKKLMPYLEYDEEPYMVVRNDGSLVWVLDAYTTSNNYPYSQKTKITVDGVEKEINYIRNSVKVIIDAYNGTTSFYITDKTDPIIMMYYKIYPEIFVNIDETIPEDIQENMVYPKLLYKVQSQILELYHNVNTEILYRGDDIWQVAMENSKEKIEMEPYYTTVSDDSNETTVGLVVPYTKQGRQSLTSYLVGKCTNGKNVLKLYNFNQETTLPAMEQLNVQINQDETIAKTLQSLSESGTEIVSRTYIVPLNNSILYVEPIYQVLLNEGNIPLLKKIIVATGSQVAIGDNLGEALASLVSESALKFEFIDTENADQLINAIIKANNNLEESLESGNWEMIGKDIKTLQKFIKQLEDLKEKETKQKSNNILNITGK